MWDDLVGYAHATRIVSLPKQGRGGDVRYAPHPPVPAVSHLANHLPHGLMHPYRVADVQDRLRVRRIHRTDTQVDMAIQSAREALHADVGVWADPDTIHGWEDWCLDALTVGFLDLDYDEVFEVAP